MSARRTLVARFEGERHADSSRRESPAKLLQEEEPAESVASIYLQKSGQYVLVPAGEEENGC